MSCPLLVDGTKEVTRANGRDEESGVEKPCINARDN